MTAFIARKILKCSNELIRIRLSQRLVMQKLFGTDGIRGKADEYPLDAETVQRIGAAAAKYFLDRLGRPPKFIYGRDTRESGPEIEAAFHAGAALTGATGESAGVFTTPGVAFLTRKFDFDAGVVISASHNPYHDNGIKIFLPSGQKLEEAAERLIEAEVFREGSVEKAKSVQLDSLRAAEFRSAYLGHLSENFRDLDLLKMKIVADCANGAACGFADSLFGSYGAEVVVINDRPDGRNINENCGSLHLENLRDAVKREHADFGVAFDGDADRALFIDENGEVVDGDATLWILAKDLKCRGELASGKVVATVMSNIGLEAVLRDADIELIRTAVGDKHVLEELLRSGSELGGEQSGHIILPKASLVGDGMMTALFMLNAIRNNATSFSETRAGFRKYPQRLVNIRVKEKKPFDAVLAIVEAAEKVERELSSEGRLLLRYSGTENLARVMVEGKDQTEVDALANSLADVIREQLG